MNKTLKRLTGGVLSLALLAGVGITVGQKKAHQVSAHDYESCAVSASLEDGKYLITALYDGSTTYMLGTSSNSALAFDATKVSDVDPKNAWNISNNNGTLTITNSNGDYLYVSKADNNALAIGNVSDTWVIQEDGSLKETKNSRYVGVYNNSNWRTYNSSTHTNYKGSATAITLYKYIEKEVTSITKIEGTLSGIVNYDWDFSNITVKGTISGSTDVVDITDFCEFTVGISFPASASQGTTSVTATAKSKSLTANDISYNVIEAHSGTSAEDAFTIEEAIDHMADGNSNITDLYYVRGILTANPDNTTYGNFYISNDGSETKTIRVYGATITTTALSYSSGKWTFTNPKDWATKEETKNIGAGYEVVMHARLYKFGTTNEIDGVVVSSKAPAINSIAVTNAPSKVEYEAGQSFDASGMVVKAYYGIDTTVGKEISGYTVDPSGALTVGTTFVTISFTDGGITKSTTQPITVTAPITDWAFKSIVLSAGTGKTSYKIGDTFVKDGFSVIYTEHSEIAGKDRETEVIDSATINNFDSSAEKTCYVTATYGGHTSNSIEVSIVDIKSYPQLMDASKIVEGMVIRIGSAAKNAVAGAFDTKYLSSVEATFDDGLTSVEAGVDFTIGKSGDYYTLTSSEGSLKANNADLSYTAGTDTWTISIDDSGNAIIASSENASNRILYNSGSPRFKTYTSATTISNLLPEIYVVSVPKVSTAESFATKFISDTDSICVNTGDNSSALEGLWDGFAVEFGKLDDTEKAKLVNAQAKSEGTVVENAMARYDHIVAKYGLTNFIDRSIPASARIINFANSNNNTSTIIIVIVSVVSLTTLGALIMIKRRKTTDK